MPIICRGETETAKVQEIYIYNRVRKWGSLSNNALVALLSLQRPILTLCNVSRLFLSCFCNRLRLATLGFITASIFFSRLSMSASWASISAILAFASTMPCAHAARFLLILETILSRLRIYFLFGVFLINFSYMNLRWSPNIAPSTQHKIISIQNSANQQHSALRNTKMLDDITPTHPPLYKFWSVGRILDFSQEFHLLCAKCDRKRHDLRQYIKFAFIDDMPSKPKGPNGYPNALLQWENCVFGKIVVWNSLFVASYSNSQV